MNIRSFGKSPGGERLERIRSTNNYRDGRFHNVEPTEVNPGNVSFFKILKEMLSRPSSVRPSGEIPHVKTNLKQLNGKGPAVVWFGHSSYFLQVDGFKILIDPVFSGNASPFRFFGKAFEGSDTYNAEDLPELDLLVLTHDHYDHLDWPSIRKLVPKTKQIVASLGVGAHLEYWGVENEKIIELSWWQDHAVNEQIKITATPSRHFSGRGFKRGETLWSSFVLGVNSHKFFLGGDSGYDGSFSGIGKKYGPFDLAFLECGQYGKYWPQIHMFPEQTLMAGKDLQARQIMPVHWGKFVLSTHPWNEPIRRFTSAAQKEDFSYAAPRIGEPYYFQEKYDQQAWWEFETKTRDHGR